MGDVCDVVEVSANLIFFVKKGFRYCTKSLIKMGSATRTWWAKFSVEKQEFLLKLVILTVAAILEGFYKFHNWFDDRAWYPLGRIIGGTIYPGLMVTSTVLYHFLNFLHISIEVRNVCVFLAPLFSSLTSLVTYFLTSELFSEGAGLVAASMSAIVPGYISRSVAGSYDNEGIAIFCMLFTYYLWIKSVKTGQIYWAALCSVAYFYMVSSWGGYVFLINLIPMHVFTLIVCGRFTHKIYIAYSTV